MNRNPFLTTLQISKAPFQISYNDEIMLLGSCFSEHIGNKLDQAFFRVLQNPFGILYNPASIATCLEHILSDKIFTVADLFLHQGLWHSALHHGDFSDIEPHDCVDKINTTLLQARKQIIASNTIIITFGTAWIYEQSGCVVGNCHKLPAKNFERRRLSVQEIVSKYSKLISSLGVEKRFVFTVSPVRHWKDGAHENQLSKSILLLAIEDICKQHANCMYFPSYEIMLDELRDYRFYASDMLHPNPVAVDYIWKRFAETFFTIDTQKQQVELEHLQRDLQHRPLHPETEEYKIFRKRVEAKKELLAKDFPWIR